MQNATMRIMRIQSLIFLLSLHSTLGFVQHASPTKLKKNLSSSIKTFAQSRILSELPEGISPFEKSLSKSIDVQANFRAIAKDAIDSAIDNDIRLMEVEFPPLIGGDLSKSQFDDFDNIQELDKNKDWTILLAPYYANKKGYGDGKTWLVFPDLKECEIARKEWQGSRYKAATFTTIEAVTNFYSEGKYDAPWGSSLVSGVSKLMGGDDGDAGLLGDQSSLDPLIKGDNGNAPAKLAFFIQPGNGGPVEDWINCEKIYEGDDSTTHYVMINGALDKVRGGYYPAIFFPKLAKTVDRFYKKFESVFYLKPITQNGVYGWLFRVYPEVCIHLCVIFTAKYSFFFIFLKF